MAGIVLLFINEKQFRDLRGDVMPMKVLAEVDVAKEMRGGTLKFPTGKKRLVDVTGGISCYRRCLQLRLCLATLVILWRRILEKLMLCFELFKSSVHWCLLFTARGVYSALSEVEGYVEEFLRQS